MEWVCLRERARIHYGRWISSRIECSWDILENRDGGLLDIIYAGPSDGLIVAGDIEGKVPIREATASRYKNNSVGVWGLLPGVAGIFVSAVFSLMGDIRLKRRMTKNTL